MSTFPDTLIVTATLGTRATLERTIVSVKNIGKERVKHVIVAPANKCLLLKQQYPFIEVLAEPANCKSIYEALNFGFKKYAHLYKYCGFINDDDYWLDDFSHLFQTMDTNPVVDVVYAKTIFVDKNNVFIGEQTSSPRYQAFGILLKVGIVLLTQQATLAKNKYYACDTVFDTKYSLVADTKFWLQLIKGGAKLKYINKACSAYMIQEGQLSSNKQLQQLEMKTLLNNEVNISSSVSIFTEKLFYRLYNIPIYLKRFIVSKSLLSPFNR